MSARAESPSRLCANSAIDRLIGRYCPRQNAAILDVGCGDGLYYGFFASRGIAGHYAGVDIKAHPLWQDRREGGLDISYAVCDAENLADLNGGYDFIIAIQSLEHMENDAAALNSMKDCLRNSGLILVTVPATCSFALYGPHGHRRYSLSSIRKLARDNSLTVIEAVRLGGAANFVLHFILWTIPAVFLKVKIWRFYQKSRRVVNLIERLWRLSLNIDRTLPFAAAGYAVVLKSEPGQDNPSTRSSAGV